MALLKEKSTNYGISAAYWRVGMITIDTHRKEACFSMFLYYDKNAKEYLESFAVTDLMGLEDKTLFDKYFKSNDYKDIYNACYGYAKENVEFFMDAIGDE